MSASTATRALSVTDVLRDRIFAGDIPPGKHLMEIALANELNVSRTPVRDALVRLADEGLLIYHPNRGFMVRQFDAKDVFDSFTLRSNLEALGCRLIGEKGLYRDVHDQLLAQLSAQEEVLYGSRWDDSTAQRWQDLNLDFHYCLLDLADNRWLTEAVRRSRQLPIVFDSRSRPHRHSELLLQIRLDHSRQAYQEHKLLVEALRRREVVRAEALMREHILTNRDVVVRLLESKSAESARDVAVLTPE